MYISFWEDMEFTNYKGKSYKAIYFIREVSDFNSGTCDTFENELM